MKTNPCPSCEGSGLELDRAATGVEMRRLRKTAGLSMLKLARLMGVDESFICRLELGQKRWNETLVQKYQRYCK